MISDDAPVGECPHPVPFDGILRLGDLDPEYQALIRKGMAADELAAASDRLLSEGVFAQRHIHQPPECLTGAVADALARYRERFGGKP